MTLFTRKPKKFIGSTIRGAKSLAYQAGIPPTREPDYQAYFGGVWTLIYTGKTV